jgi:excisionase family DNA binding protein
MGLSRDLTARNLAGLSETQAFHTVQELKALLRIGESQAYAAVASGVVRAVKIGGSWRIPHSEFERLQRGEAHAS